MTTTRKRRAQERAQREAETRMMEELAARVGELREAAMRGGKGKLWTKATLIGLATGIVTVASALPGCAATIGSEYKQSEAGISDTNPDATYRTSIKDNSGERHYMTGNSPAGYNVVDDKEARSLYNGASPTSVFTKRTEDGRASLGIFSASNNTFRAGSFEYNPETGGIVGTDVELGADAASSTRAVNEALVVLAPRWTARDEASKEAIIEQIKAGKEIPKDLAPLIVQLLLSL